MRAALEISRRWAREGKEVAAATLVSMGGSTPRRAGARLIVSSAGDTWGSVSFGCVETDVATHAGAVLDSGQPRLAAYGVTDEDAFAVGFTCGGTMEVFIEPWTHLHDLLGGLPGEEFLGAMATVVSGPGAGNHGLFDREGGLVAGSVSPVPTEVLAPDVGAAADDEQARLVECQGTRVFVEPLVPSPRLIVFGAGHTAQALTAAAAAVGFRVTVSDHRPAVAFPERYPEAAEVVLGWPDQVVPVVAPDSRTYVVCLAHNPEVEDVLLPLVLASETRYVGVLGSRRTHAARVARLIAAGMPEEQLARLHAPVGLDLGAVTPEEIAVSIVAELVAVRRMRSPGAEGGGTRPG
jgi:xanthine dehydrogenase accessory factor